MSSDRKVLIVTGGSRGIGAAITRLAARDGYAVCFSYAHGGETAGELQRELGSRGCRVHGVRADIVDPDQVRMLFDQAEAVFGSPVALVNNAGITGKIGLFRDAELATLRRVVDVNVLGTMLCAQEAVRRWTAVGVRGSMVNISSVASTLGAAHEHVHYAATKAAVEALTIGLAREVAASGTRVNAVAPGTVFTGIHAAAGEPDRPARVVARVPMGRIGEAEEIAEAVLWLLSDKASYVTGSVLRVSGGV
jgi:NAD(P)-dependent dehydrogenase (short-subunit alcohol dehydrogenase family)